MNDLAEFLRARYAEERAEAERQPDEGAFDMDPWEIRKDVEGGWPSTDYLRIAKLRVFAEADAKLAIIKAHPVTRDVTPESPDGRHGFGCETCHQDEGLIIDRGWCVTLRALAAVYAEHPGYYEGWRP